MDDLLRHVYNACEPHRAASEAFYTDCAPARGSGNLAEDFLRHLSLSQAGNYRCFLFSGHVGCGKSSELIHVCTALRDAAAGQRHFPILLDLNEYLDHFDVDVTDILLAMVTELSATLRQDLGVTLKDGFFSQIFAGATELLSDLDLQAEIGGKVGYGPTEANAKIKLQRLKKDPSLRTRVRQALEPRMTPLLEEINKIFHEARKQVQEATPADGIPYRDFVLILDNLEKIRKLRGFGDGLISQRELFLERYTQLTGLAAHLIYTVPLRLLRHPVDGPQLNQHYGRSFVLPMIKVADRQERKPYTQGIQCLKILLSRRLGEHSLDELFTPDALDALIQYSGGHVRQLMTTVQNACTYTAGLPIRLPSIQRAIAQNIALYSSSIPQSFWVKLAELDRSADQQIPNGDVDYLAMLESLSVLEYLNGGTEAEPFSPMEPWYAVNPVVRELRRFKDMLNALEQTRETRV